jgi:predicted PurR-regulated permease PerM
VTAFFFALLLLILYGAFLILTPFLTAITWAAILAILFYPVYAALLELMRGRATLAAMTVIVVITIIVIAPGVELARFLADEAVSLLQSVRLLLDEDGKQQWLAQPWVQHLIGWWDMATFRLVDFKIDWKNLLIQGAQSSSTFIVAQVKGIAQNVLLFTVNFIVALFTLFFFLRDGAELVRRIQRLLPMDQEHQQRLFKNIVDSVLAVVHGSLVVAMVQGLLAGLVGRGHGLCLAVAGGWVGDRFDTGRDLLVSPGRNGARSRAVGLVLGICRHGGHILKPLLIGNRLGLPVLFLFFGILGGLALFGAVGIVLGPALFALLRALLDLYSEEYSNIERP